MSEMNGDSNGHGEPSEPVSDGRDAAGRFGPNNKFSRGNPFAKSVNLIRAAMFKVWTPEVVEEAAKAIAEKAKAGDVPSFNTMNDRTVGKSIGMDVEERLSALEAAIAERNAEARR